MTTVEEYLQQLAAVVRVRGRARRRFLTECRDHLADASADSGVVEAVRRFGDAAAVARAFDTSVAVRRAFTATMATGVAVLGVAVSTDVVLHTADQRATALIAWAVVFFAAAQTSGVSTVLAVLLTTTIRQQNAAPGDVALIVRRAYTALAAAFVTEFAAAAAVPGHAPAWQILSGPILALVAVGLIARLQKLTRAIEPRRTRVVREPLGDVLTLLRRRRGLNTASNKRSPLAAVGPVVVLAAAAAFTWDHLDHGTLRTSTTAAGIEAALTVAGFVALGHALGLRPARRHRRS